MWVSNNNLEQQAQAILLNAISSASEIRRIPLETIATVKGGKRLPKGVNLIAKANSHPYIRVRDLNNVLYASLTKNYEYVDDETQKSIARYTVDKNDVLISIVGTIGLTAIVDYTLSGANLTENCVKLTDLNTVNPEYLITYLRSAEGQNAIAKGTVGAVQAKLPIKNIQSIEIPVLDSNVLNEVCSSLHAVYAQISTNVIESRTLADLRDTLLPKLISGEIDVSDIDL